MPVRHHVAHHLRVLGKNTRRRSDSVQSDERTDRWDVYILLDDLRESSNALIHIRGRKRDVLKRDPLFFVDVLKYRASHVLVSE